MHDEAESAVSTPLPPELSSRHRHGKNVAVLLLLAALLLALVQIALFHDLRHDDAYITYRYGQNLARGEGLVFNPGERHLATTSPGQALLSALVYATVGPQVTPSVMSALGCLGWTAQAVSVYLLLLPLVRGRDSGGSIFAFLAALAFGLGAAGSHHWVALETNLAVACTLWALVLAQRAMTQVGQSSSTWTTVAALCAVAGLLRPDAYLMAAILGAAWLVYGRPSKREIWPPLAAFFVLSAPWYLFATLYYGSPLPQSAVTKFQRVDLVEYATHIADHAAGELMLSPSLAATLVAWTLVILGTVWLLRRHPRLWPLPTYGAAHFLAYLYLRPYEAHTWHLYPGVAVFVILALATITAASRHGRARPVLALALTVLVAGYGARFIAEARGHATEYWSGARDQAYRSMAEHLRSHTGQDDLIVSLEVGTLAYWSDRRFADLGGLVTPPDELATRLAAPVAPGQRRWMVLDRLYLHLAQGRRPVAAFRAESAATSQNLVPQNAAPQDATPSPAETAFEVYLFEL